MMLPWGVDREPESYKDYKNRTISKLESRAKQLEYSINDCSLKGEDKLKLRKRVLEIFSQFNNKQ